MFLDIEMPDITGLDLMKSLKTIPKVILTTAHRKYALEGYDLDVVDYLLKPIPFDRFIKAIDKYYKSASINESNQTLIKSENENIDDHIFVKENRKMIKVILDEILFIESMKDYCIIHTGTNNIITKISISEFESKLPDKDFIRIHRSFIAAKNKIDAYTPASIEIGKKELVIGRNYKNEVIKQLQN